MKKIVILALLGDPMVPATAREARAGGFNTDVKQWLSFLTNKNYPITVFTNTSLYFQDRIQCICENITIYRIPLDESSFKNASKLMEQYLFVLDQIKTVITKEKITPAFIHSFFWYSGYLAMKLADFYKVPFIHTIIDLSAYKKMAKVPTDYRIQESCELIFFQKAACVMAITEEEKRIFLENYNVEEERVIVIGREVDSIFLHPDHNTLGIANTFLDSKDYSENRPLPMNTIYYSNSSWWNQGAFLYMGRINQLKGVPIIVKAWYKLYQQYKENTLPLWIAGGTPNAIQDLRKQLEKDIPNISMLEDSMKICWWGYLSPKALSTILMKAAVLIAHSQYEAGGLVVIEAMSSGVPVIATPVGFAKDCICDWENGFLVPYHDINSLAKRMEHFILQPLLSQVLGRYAQKTYFYYIKQWNYFEKQLSIYEHYWNKKPFNKENFSQIAFHFSEKSDYERGLLDTYPYPLYILSKKDIIEIGNTHFLSGNVFLDKERSNHSNIWEIASQNGRFVLKNVYTTINKNRIWNNIINKEVISASEQMQKLLQSSKSIYTVDFLIYDEKQCYCAMKEYPVITSITSRETLFRVMNLTKKFSDDMNRLIINDERENLSCNLYTCHPVTLHNAFQELLDISDMFCSNFLNAMQPQISSVQSYLAGAKHKEVDFSIHYGKTLSNHVVQADADYKLLPTASIFEGTLGYDAANLLIEFWLCTGTKIPSKIYTDLQKSNEIYDTSDKTICLWCIIILMTKIKQEYVFSAADINKVYIYLLDILINNLII